MNISKIFIERPVLTTLIMAALVKVARSSMVPVLAPTVLEMKSTLACSLPPAAPGIGTVASSLPAAIWF